MNNEYYGVASTPMDDFLAHYGVKGMKWGVRKAIQSGNSKALDRQFNKAAKKLAKLNARTDIEVQTKNANKYNKIAKKFGKIGSAGAALALAGTGTDHTLHYINSLHKKITKSELADLDRKSSKEFDDHWSMIVWNDKQHNEGKISDAEYAKNDAEIVKSHTDVQNSLEKQHDDIVNNFNSGKDKRKLGADIGRYVGYAGAGIGALGLGTAAVAKGKAIAAKKRTTEKGHAKALADRDTWKNEMKSAFKGTKYAGRYTVSTKKRRKK